MFEVRALLANEGKTRLRDAINQAGMEAATSEGMVRSRDGKLNTRLVWRVKAFRTAQHMREMLEVMDGVSATFREM